MELNASTTATSIDVLSGGNSLKHVLIIFDSIFDVWGDIRQFSIKNICFVLFMTQCFDRIQTRGFHCWEVAKDHAHRSGEQKRNKYNACVEDEGNS